MKKIQRSFSVEFKSGRRKADAKANSIWGNLDLKSVAREVERSVMPTLPERLAIDGDGEIASCSETNRQSSTLTTPAAKLKAVAGTQETYMAEENDGIADAGTLARDETPASGEAPADLGALNAQKKQPTRRVKENSAETTAANTQDSLDGGVVRKRRGRKPKALLGAANTQDGLDGSVVRKRRGRKPKALLGAADVRLEQVSSPIRSEQTAPPAAAYAEDEMADLARLEEENQKLRKLLAEKLRAENAALRKKLNLD